MQQNPMTTQATLRFLRMVHGALMISIVLYILVVRMVPAQNTEPLKPSMLWALDICAAITLALGQVMRSMRLRPAFETLRRTPDDPGALVRWRQGVLISDVLGEATVLYGFAVHALGGTGRQIAPFFIAGSAAMILWWPKKP